MIEFWPKCLPLGTDDILFDHPTQPLYRRIQVREQYRQAELQGEHVVHSIIFKIRIKTDRLIIIKYLISGSRTNGNDSCL